MAAPDGGGRQPPDASRGEPAAGPRLLTDELLHAELGRFASETLRRELGDLRRKVRGDLNDALRPLLAAHQQQATVAPVAPPLPLHPRLPPPLDDGELLFISGAHSEDKPEAKAPDLHSLDAESEPLRSVAFATSSHQVQAVRRDSATPTSTHMLEVWAKRGPAHPTIKQDLQKEKTRKTVRRSRIPTSLVGNRSWQTEFGSRNEGSGVRSSTPAWGEPTEEGGRGPHRYLMSLSMPLEAGPPRTYSEMLKDFVNANGFDYASSACVVVNSVIIGMQTDWQARHLSGNSPPFFRTLEIVFACIYSVELFLRLLAYRSAFLREPHGKWHIFDSVLLISQLLEEAMSALLQYPDGSLMPSRNGVKTNVGILRIMRILRLTRVIRLVRILRMIGELRTLVMSIIGSLRSLLWAVVLLFILMYMVGIYLTQLVLDYRLDDEFPLEYSAELDRYYGNLGDSILTVYESITGGNNWDDCLAPLRYQISVFLVPFFMLYIAFTLLCMLNVITGFFVESALLTAKKDKDNYLVNNVRQLFDALDTNHSGSLSWQEFQDAVETKEMQAVLAAIEIDVCEAEGLFHLLDSEDSGHIGAEDFVTGCARLRGPAKALELAILMREVAQQANMFKHFIQVVDRRLKTISHTLEHTLPGHSLAAAAPPRPAPPSTPLVVAPPQPSAAMSVPILPALLHSHSVEVTEMEV